ncbi:MAG: EI24 domain-containing protein [Bacteroidia bacterium]|nr:EI24 domain-containing protein [Bacteroidia bacterium]
MKFFQQLGLGFSSYGNAFGILFTKGLWWTFIFPVLLIFLLFLAGFQSVDLLTDWVKSSIFQATNIEQAQFWGSGFVKGLMTGVIWVLFKIIFFFLFSYFGGFIILIIMSPVLAFLSERTEKALVGHQYPFSLTQLMRDMVRGILIALRNLLIQLACVIGLLLLSAIPILGWIIGIFSPVIIFFLTSYFYGFSFMDYSNERRKLSISKSVRIIRKYKWVAVANGMILSLLIILPLCGIGTLVCPFAAIVSVVAGAVAMEKIYQAEGIALPGK